MRLLLMEDEAAIRSALARAMRSWGHEVAVAASLAEAREAIATTPPDALVSDLKLPDGSGLDLARELGVPFVLMSGFAAFDDAVSALRLGCVDFLTKPVAMKTLQQAIGHLGERAGHGDLFLVSVDGDRVRALQPSATGLQEQDVCAQEAVWSSREQAREAFDVLGASDDGDRERRVLAELLQATDAGRLVVNRGGAWWRAWLDAAVDWQADQEARDRRVLLDDLVDRSLFRSDGTVVECNHDRE